MIPRYRILAGAGAVIIALVLISAGVKYEMAKSSCVFLEKQNVLYLGVDNPISIYVAGVAPADVYVKASGCTITSTNRPGHHIIRANSGVKANVSVWYVQNGDSLNAGVYEFRIKKIPDPVAYINSFRTEGVILKENLQTVNGIFTRMENFDFDCSFKPQSFSMSVIEEGEWKEYKATGPELTAEMKTALTKCEEEDKILFHNVMTKGPDSTLRKVNTVTITVK